MAESPLSLSLTQTSEKSPHIFVDSSGSPLSVFLEVNSEIPARPRLIRLLRASGADISHNPSDADILLINSETDSGLKFVHDWKADPHKTFLRYHWIQACIRAGRALLEAEDWGGFRVFHASNCVYSDEEGYEGLEDAQNETRPSMALQHTPNERAVPSTPSFGSKAVLNPTHPKPPSPARPWSRQSAKLNTPTLAPRSPIPSSRNVSNSMPAQSPSNLDSSTAMSSSPKLTAGISTQPTSIHRHTAPTILPKHTTLNSRLPQQSSTPPHPFPEATDTLTLASSLSRVTEPSMSQNQSFPLAVNNSEPQHPPPAGSMDLLNALNYAFQIQNTASQVQNAASQTLTQLVETIIAVAQVQGMDTAIIQNYLATLPMSSSLVQLSPSSHIQEPALRPVGEHAGSSVPDSSLGDLGKDSASTRTSRIHVSPESALPATRKRKSLELPPSSKRVTPNSRQNPPGVSVEPPPSEGSIFSAKNGRPILVFVQIDIRGRHEIVHLIKKNGGKITADIPKANFAILNPRSVSYADLRQEADDSGRTIVQTSFITESIKQGRLLDPSDFLLGGVSSPKKVNRMGRRPASFRDRHSPESDLATPEAQAPGHTVNASSSIPIPTRKRSITPEPPAAVQSKHGYKFTPAEMTYTWALVRRIITRDPSVSKFAVTKALHEKMPHHTMPSWASTMTRHKDMYESVRLAALGLAASGTNTPNSQQGLGNYHSLNESSDVEMIEAGRDAEKLEELQVGASLIVAEDGSDDELQPLEGENEDRNERDAYARDFEAIVEFLISPDADIGQEHEIFERLTAKSICITAPSWSVFLDKHGEAVKEEVDRRYRAQRHE